MRNRIINIKHPEHLRYSTPGKTLSLYNAGILPESIAGWMIVTSLKHPLRAIYGSDLKAAWHLLLMSIKDKWFHLKYRVFLQRREDGNHGQDQD